MKTHTENPVSNVLIAAMLALTTVFAAVAMQSDAQSDPRVSRDTTKTTRPPEACPECYVRPPVNAGYELPEDMKPAERIDTF
jgi:hypothetical protein